MTFVSCIKKNFILDVIGSLLLLPLEWQESIRILPQPGGSGPRGSFSADIIDAWNQGTPTGSETFGEHNS